MPGPTQIIISLLPVCLFLLALFMLDSFKLVKPRSVLLGILAGALAALACYFLNRWLLAEGAVSATVLRRYLAPVVEESLKAALLVTLFKRKKIGFMVDAAILGFAVGTGFALVENIYYLGSLQGARLPVWLIRGFGTAILHGGTTVLVGIITRGLMDRRRNENLRLFLPGLGLAVLLHSLFNHLFFHPVFYTLALLLVLPPLIFLVFEHSERILRGWLEGGFAADMQLLRIIRSGEVLDSKIGQYLAAIKDHVPGEVLADMLCYLQISVELALKAKGTLMMQEAGFQTEPDREVRDQLIELKQLGRHIGRTGRMILAPFLHTRSQDLWQIELLRNQRMYKPNKQSRNKYPKEGP